MIECLALRINDFDGSTAILRYSQSAHLLKYLSKISLSLGGQHLFRFFVCWSDAIDFYQLYDSAYTRSTVGGLISYRLIHHFLSSTHINK